MITVFLNSSPREISAETVAEMVAEMGLPSALLLIEQNGKALTRTEWDGSRLHEGDRLEILRVSAGG
jgi:thiamine biosynthesis protein ThiS